MNTISVAFILAAIAAGAILYIGASELYFHCQQNKRITAVDSDLKKAMLEFDAKEARQMRERAARQNNPLAFPRTHPAPPKTAQQNKTHRYADSPSSSSQSASPSDVSDVLFYAQLASASQSSYSQPVQAERDCSSDSNDSSSSYSSSSDSCSSSSSSDSGSSSSSSD